MVNLWRHVLLKAIWGPSDDGLVFVGWDNEPRRLGLIYCSNRKYVVSIIEARVSCKYLLLGLQCIIGVLKSLSWVSPLLSIHDG